jgi:hypothetical protein
MKTATAKSCCSSLFFLRLNLSLLMCHFSLYLFHPRWRLMWHNAPRIHLDPRYMQPDDKRLGLIGTHFELSGCTANKRANLHTAP